jgi:hypothetical protein
MSLDGSLSGRKIQGKLFRPVSTDFAKRNFPNLVVEMALGRVNNSSIKISRSINGKQIVTISGLNLGYNFVLLKEDFDLIKESAETLGDLPLFSSDKLRDYRKRAEGIVEQLFAGRE